VQESGNTTHVFASPRHPYTQLLISAVPVLTQEEEALQPRFPAAPPESAVATPAGVSHCSFASRCPFVMERCRHNLPSLLQVESEEVRCFLYRET
jgi:oligopeptide/dipeptide ABC transporter ATP-binding protein